MRRFHTRVIVENYYEPCILYLLMQRPSYGYKLRDDLKKQLACEVNIGNLYRCLKKLHEKGHIRKYKEPSEEGPDRVMYRMNESGKKLLGEWVEDLKKEKHIISTLTDNYQE